MYPGNSKTLLREGKENLKKWRNIQCSWVGKLCITKMTAVSQIDLWDSM